MIFNAINPGHGFDAAAWYLWLNCGLHCFFELCCFCFATDNFDIRQTWVLCNFLINLNPFYTTNLFLYPPENMRKPKVTSGMKWLINNHLSFPEDK